MLNKIIFAINAFVFISSFMFGLFFVYTRSFFVAALCGVIFVFSSAVAIYLEQHDNN